MFNRAIVRLPGRNYADGITSANLGLPAYDRTLQQHAAYCEALERCGLELTYLQADEKYADSTFVEDTAVLVPSAAIITRPGAASRRGEVESISETLAGFYPQIHSILEPATLDGGDVCAAGNHFYIGISERTNEAGAGQLAELLASYQYTSSRIDIRSMKGTLHLKSGLAYLGDNRLVVTDALAEREEFDGYELVRISQHDEYAANCVRVNNSVLIAAGYPGFQQALRHLGYETVALEVSEFQKMDGGLSCLSLRFYSN